MTADGHALAELVAGLPPVGLSQVLERTELLTRLDRKYLVPNGTLPRIFADLAGRYAALEIHGRRHFRYSSTYFDTPDLLTYRQHRQGRRRRFKFRTRSYLDSGECVFEVKMAGVRGQTDKRRIRHDLAQPAELTPDSRQFLTHALLTAYRMNPPEDLRSNVTTSYTRVTLVQRAGLGRVTFDTGLIFTDRIRTVSPEEGHVLVETKSPGTATPMDRILLRHGVRPIRLSKYCLAVAVLDPCVRANPWHPVLRRWFGHRR